MAARTCQREGALLLGGMWRGLPRRMSGRQRLVGTPRAAADHWTRAREVGGDRGPLTQGR